jgi:hypothetical protein
MKVNRRGFLGALIAGAAAAAVDPERLLWVPGRKLISIPAPRVAMVAEILRIRQVGLFDRNTGEYLWRMDAVFGNFKPEAETASVRVFG